MKIVYFKDRRPIAQEVGNSTAQQISRLVGGNWYGASSELSDDEAIAEALSNGFAPSDRVVVSPNPTQKAVAAKWIATAVQIRMHEVGAPPSDSERKALGQLTGFVVDQLK